MVTLNNPSLAQYREKRRHGSTPEPFGRLRIPATGKLFVVQQHAASHLHFDLRLEMDGVLKSWAVPKGPSDDPADKRFAVETEDHPLDYADFEGEIPPGNYGAGHVIVWDRGTFELQGDFDTGFAKGKLLFELRGHKLRGRWTLVRMKTKNTTGREWLFIKELDDYVSEQGPTFGNTSVLSGRTVQELADATPPTALLKRLRGVRKHARSPLKKLSTRPMLATSGEAHNRRGWLWELKYDGYRIVASKAAGETSLTTRNGIDISERFPEICQVLTHLPATDIVLDGELVVNDAFGRPSFARMQQRARATAQLNVSRAAIETPANYYCFDALAINGIDLRNLPLVRRKAVLQTLVPVTSALIYSAHVEDKGREVMATATQLGVEGVVGKRAQSVYQHGRSADWIKVRNQRHSEFVIAGWSTADKADLAVDKLSSVALAEYRNGELTYVGHAGSGLNHLLRTELAARLRPLLRKTPPVKLPGKTRGQSANRHHGPNKPTQWVRPRVVVEVHFTEYTPHGHLRHPVIQRLRDDKSADECVGVFDTPPDNVQLTGRADTIPPVVTTNPGKIFFPAAPGKTGGFLKHDVVNYYRNMAPWLLPYLQQRPIVLTRFPDGVDGKSFYQRDLPDYVPDWLQRARLWSESTEREIAYCIVRHAEDLAYLANMGTLPIHMWHATLTDIERPDWCVLDLDPKGAPFRDVITLAQAIGELADEIDLPAYPKTSGASGLHVLLPLAGQLTHKQAQTLGELLANVIVSRYPHIATVARSVRARQQKVYVDYLQNGHGRLIVAPFAVRAEPAGSVSMPLRWHEVNGRLQNSNFHIGNARRRLQRLGQDPLLGVLTDAPDMVRVLEKLMTFTGGT